MSSTTTTTASASNGKAGPDRSASGDSTTALRAQLEKAEADVAALAKLAAERGEHGVDEE